MPQASTSAVVAKRNPSRMKAMAMLAMILVIISITGVSATVNNITDTLSTMSVGDTRLVSNNIAITLESVQSVAFNDLPPEVQQELLASKQYSNGTLEKRAQCFPIISTYTQTQVVQTGTWWSSWYPSSSCLYCGLDPKGCAQTVDYSYTYTEQWSTGVTEGLVATVLSIIQASAQFSDSYSWSKSWMTGGSQQCNVAYRSRCQVWTQNLMGWSNSQTQSCTVLSGCGSHLSCGAWSPYYHIDFPLTGDGNQGRSYNYGCSCGTSNTQC
ncbi:uncharacterized protein V1513DRAFT_434438 [Lipomyces chichibuensis]|uniref:uncharacterized protein n=1 Tax=Lipomyces chichibuensis TaxID=1546026 RepID=UPI003342F5A6